MRHQSMFLSAIGLSVPALAILATSHANGQVVQLPTVRTFGMTTTVSVPDRGAVLMGGVTRSANSRSSRRVPGLGSAATQGHSLSGAHVIATIIDLQAWDAAVLAEARRRKGKSNSPIAAARPGHVPRQLHHMTTRPPPHATRRSSPRATSRLSKPTLDSQLSYEDLMYLGRQAKAAGQYGLAKKYFLAAAGE